jgi:hypothetical protein
MGMFAHIADVRDRKEHGAADASHAVNGFLIPAQRVQSAQSLAYVKKNGLDLGDG